ncbi:MAG: DUF5721 family protein [Wujia sp.]
MQVYEIEDTKQFMQELLKQERYDSFYLYEARVKTKLDYYVSGKLNPQYLDTQDEADCAQEGQTHIEWKDIKSTVFSFMDEDRMPISFKIILMFHKENILRLLEMNHVAIAAADVRALFLNIVYEQGQLHVTTGTSLDIFTMDKTLEHLWDETVQKYYI